MNTSDSETIKDAHLAIMEVFLPYNIARDAEGNLIHTKSFLFS